MAKVLQAARGSVGALATLGPPTATIAPAHRRGGEATAIVLAMHALPPRDFPHAELAELFAMHGRLERSHGSGRAELARRYRELDARVRTWPRTGTNDPFFIGSHDLAAELERETGCPVFVGFNEFCAPDLDEALDRAAGAADLVAVLTPMMTAGGEHSEVDIPAAIERAQGRHPEVRFVYAWPFATLDVARFLVAQLKRFVPLASRPAQARAR